MSFLALCRQVGLKDLVSNVSAYPTSGEASGGLNMLFKRWATKKTAGSTKNGRDSHPKFLGVKKFGGEKVIPGNIIVRQRGTRFHPGEYVGMGKDHTLYALKEGHVRFERHKLSGRKWVHVNPSEGHVLHPIYQSTAASDASGYFDIISCSQLGHTSIRKVAQLGSLTQHITNIMREGMYYIPQDTSKVSESSC